MSPAPTLDHQDVVGEVYRQLANALEGKACRAYVSPVDVRVLRADEDDEDIDTVVQPGVLVICDRASRASGGLSLCELPVQSFREPTTGQSVLVEKVSHAEGSPVVRPRLNQLTRCAELPWVKLSGVT